MISNVPSPATSNPVSLSTPTVPEGKAPSSAPASTVNDTYTAPPVLPRTRTSRPGAPWRRGNGHRRCRRAPCATATRWPERRVGGIVLELGLDARSQVVEDDPQAFGDVCRGSVRPHSSPAKRSPTSRSVASSSAYVLALGHRPPLCRRPPGRRTRDRTAVLPPGGVRRREGGPSAEDAGDDPLAHPARRRRRPTTCAVRPRPASEPSGRPASAWSSQTNSSGAAAATTAIGSCSSTGSPPPAPAPLHGARTARRRGPPPPPRQVLVAEGDLHRHLDRDDPDARTSRRAPRRPHGGPPPALNSAPIASTSRAHPTDPPIHPRVRPGLPAARRGRRRSASPVARTSPRTSGAPSGGARVHGQALGQPARPSAPCDDGPRGVGAVEGGLASDADRHVEPEQGGHADGVAPAGARRDVARAGHHRREREVGLAPGDREGHAFDARIARDRPHATIVAPPAARSSGELGPGGRSVGAGARRRPAPRPLALAALDQQAEEEQAQRPAQGGDVAGLRAGPGGAGRSRRPGR